MTRNGKPSPHLLGLRLFTRRAKPKKKQETHLFKLNAAGQVHVTLCGYTLHVDELLIVKDSNLTHNCPVELVQRDHPSKIKVCPEKFHLMKLYGNRRYLGWWFWSEPTSSRSFDADGACMPHSAGLKRQTLRDLCRKKRAATVIWTACCPDSEGQLAGLKTPNFNLKFQNVKLHDSCHEILFL